jgi:hypothetical protein
MYFFKNKAKILRGSKMGNLIVIVFVLFAFDVKAQRDTPPNAQPGKCYAKAKADSTDVLGHWEEVLCGEKMQPRVIQDVAKALQNKGYKVNVFAELMDGQLKAALSKFQKENKLPIGNLNIKTLDALEISY